MLKTTIVVCEINKLLCNECIFLMNYIRNAHRWCAVIRKPGSAWLEGTPGMDLGHMNVVLK